MLNPAIAKIHIAKKELKLSDEQYQLVLHSATGKESCKDMTPGELNQVLREMKSRGFKAKKSENKTKYNDLANREGMASPKQLRMIEATWMNHPRVRHKTAVALRTFLKHKFRIAHLRFIPANQVGKIATAIEAIR